MGYESKIYVMGEHTSENGYFWAEVVAELNLSCCGADFVNLFTDLALGKIYGHNEDGEEYRIREDKYGEPLTAAPLEKVLSWLTENVKKEKYRRFNMLYALLKSLNTKQWEDMDIVLYHYGY